MQLTTVMGKLCGKSETCRLCMWARRDFNSADEWAERARDRFVLTGVAAVGSCSRAQKLIEISERSQGGEAVEVCRTQMTRNGSSIAEQSTLIVGPIQLAFLDWLPVVGFSASSTFQNFEKARKKTVCNRTRKWREQRNKSASEHYGCGVRSMRCSCDAIKTKHSRPWLFALKINSTIRIF